MAYLANRKLGIEAVQPQSSVKASTIVRQKPQYLLGFTLVDLMVGIALSTVLTLGLLQLFAITRQAYLTSTQFGDMLENTNAAMTMIRNVALRAGHAEPWTPIFAGCYNEGVPSAFLTSKGNMSLKNCKSQALLANMVSFALQNGNGGDNAVCWVGNNGNPYRYGQLFDSSCGEYKGGGSTFTDGYYGGSSHAMNSYFTGANNFNAIYVLRTGIENVSGRLLFTGYDGPTGGSDKLTIFAQGEGDVATSTLRDCQGNRIGRDTRVVNSIGIIYDPAGPYMACNVDSATALTNASKADMKIASNVQAMRVLYAVDTDGDGVPNTYVNAATVNNPGLAYGSKVVGIKVALLMRSEKAVAQVTDKNTYNLFGYSYGPFNDRFLRRLFHMTFMTLECTPAFRKDCGGVLFSATDFRGNTVIGRIKAGDTIWFRQSPSSPCASGVDNDRAGCVMDNDGSMKALYHARCVSGDQIGDRAVYMTKSTVSGTLVTCKAVE